MHTAQQYTLHYTVIYGCSSGYCHISRLLFLVCTSGLASLWLSVTWSGHSYYFIIYQYIIPL